ncbi:type II secretion system protein M [Saccharophagus degradans]|uniref:Type II secretion system protein M n=1 Tax=Saccharophagus degradans (strain 2-40 / ATCC 43961 / DSM 17024) TaxID=203122 RepID=Q21EQ3_SACD2|nr:type II secretion system protein M [Saccharophagus degradans]ABD82826.1 General secretion pathway M protein [Saccharophagus degradans 2-40]MBU2986136.1 type II secretion system protein M [Saccharophagus degradans]WGO98986.1 type II secretion system protein M [Saccharophagus degradans]
MNYVNEFKEWWGNASSRDQISLVVCSVCVALYILFMGVLSPLYDMRDAQVRSHESAVVTLARVKELAAQIKGSGEGNGRSGGPSIVDLVDSSLRSHGLRLSNMQPSGRSDVRLRLDEVSFNSLLAWLNEMEVEKGLQVKDMSIAESSNIGMVSVTLRLHQEN